MQVNVKSEFLLTQALLPLIRQTARSRAMPPSSTPPPVWAARAAPTE